jgi:hypothetical protein
VTVTDELTDEQYALADQIERFLEQHATTWSPSRIARAVRSSTDLVRPVLTYMLDHQYIAAIGNGARTRYTAKD